MVAGLVYSLGFVALVVGFVCVCFVGRLFGLLGFLV